jgi:hypothetical protein
MTVKRRCALVSFCFQNQNFFMSKKVEYFFIAFLPSCVSYELKGHRICSTKILQTFQSKTLRKLANAPWYISNVTLHNDLRIPHVTEVIKTYAKNNKNRTAQNNNQLIRDLFNPPEIGRKHKVTRESH